MLVSVPVSSYPLVRIGGFRGGGLEWSSTPLNQPHYTAPSWDRLNTHSLVPNLHRDKLDIIGPNVRCRSETIDQE